MTSHSSMLIFSMVFIFQAKAFSTSFAEGIFGSKRKKTTFCSLREFETHSTAKNVFVTVNSWNRTLWKMKTSLSSFCTNQNHCGNKMQWKTTAHKHAQSFDTVFHLKEFSASTVDFNVRRKDRETVVWPHDFQILFSVSWKHCRNTFICTSKSIKLNKI